MNYKYLLLILFCGLFFRGNCQELQSVLFVDTVGNIVSSLDNEIVLETCCENDFDLILSSNNSNSYRFCSRQRLNEFSYIRMYDYNEEKSKFYLSRLYCINENNVNNCIGVSYNHFGEIQEVLYSNTNSNQCFGVLGSTYPLFDWNSMFNYFYDKYENLSLYTDGFGIRIYDANNEQIYKNIEIEDCIYFLQFSWNGRYVVYGTVKIRKLDPCENLKREVVILDWKNNEEVERIKFDKIIHKAILSKDNMSLLILSANNCNQTIYNIYIYNLSSGNYKYIGRGGDACWW